MATSKYFGPEKAPAGKEFRDSGSLAKGLKDLRRDLNVSFGLVEAPRLTTATISEKTASLTVTNANAAELAVDILHFPSLTANATLAINLTGAEIKALIDAAYAEKGSNITTQVGDTFQFYIKNSSNSHTVAVSAAALEVTVQGNEVIATSTGARVMLVCTALAVGATPDEFSIFVI